MLLKNLHLCYEAGATGYVLYWQLTALGAKCEVVAPTDIGTGEGGRSEEGTCAAWLHDLLKPHVTEVLVCDSRKNALLRVGNKNDREDARKLSELLFLNKLHAVYHGETGISTLKELARRYLTITRDLTRVINRLKAIYRGCGIACASLQLYANSIDNVVYVTYYG